MNQTLYGDVQSRSKLIPHQRSVIETPMRNTATLIFAMCLALPLLSQDVSSHRPPAVPLIANDPYFSVWSMADRLTDVSTRHWSEVGGGAKLRVA